MFITSFFAGVQKVNKNYNKLLSAFPMLLIHLIAHL